MKFTNGSRYRVLTRTMAASRPTIDPLIQKLRAFRHLQPGWGHGEGVPVAEDAVRIAEYFVQTAKTLGLRADVFPGLHGDCAVAIYRDDISVEVIVSPSQRDRFGLHVEKGAGFQFERILEKDDADHRDVVKEITALISHEWKLHASSPSGNLTQTNADFRMLSSSTPQEAITLLHLMGS